MTSVTSRTYKSAALGRVLVADDHPLFREAVRHVVSAISPSAVCVETATYAETQAVVSEGEPFDLILLDLLMPGGDYFDALGRLRRLAAAVPLVVVSSREDRATVRRAMSYGIAGYIPKSTPKAEMESAVRRVLAGERYVPKSAGDLETSPPELSSLTSRQLAVLEHLAMGKSNREIATDLGIEEITVKAHISAILRKLHVKSRVLAVIASRELLDRLAGA